MWGQETSTKHRLPGKPVPVVKDTKKQEEGSASWLPVGPSGVGPQIDFNKVRHAGGLNLAAAGDEAFFLLQASLNRWASWLKVTPLKIDGIIGNKTFTFLRQVVAGFVPELFSFYFGTASPRSGAEVSASLASMTVDKLDAAANAMQIEGAAPPAKKVVEAAVVTATAGCPTCAPLATAVVGGGASLPTLWWVLAVGGALLLGAGAYYKWVR